MLFFVIFLDAILNSTKSIIIWQLKIVLTDSLTTYMYD